MFSGESKTKGMLDRLGSLMIEGNRGEAEDRTLNRKSLSKIFENEISVPEMNEQLMERKALNGRKADMSRFSDKRERANKINKRYGKPTWWQTLVDTDGEFCCGCEKYKVEHTGYEAKTNRAGEDVYKQINIWVLKDKEGKTKGFVSEEYEDISKSVRKVQDEA